MVYEYSWSGPDRAVSAQKVYEHLKAIEKNGVLTRQAFVDSARDESSDMHCLFEWDDAVAGEKWRLQQANVIIHSIRVKVVNENQENQVKTAAFVLPERTEKAGGYINIQKAMRDSESREGLLRSAKMECEWFMAKYRNLTELGAVIDAMKVFVGEE